MNPRSHLPSFLRNLNAVVIGASGGIGQAFVKLLSEDAYVGQVHAFSRSPVTLQHEKITTGHVDFEQEDTIEQAAAAASEKQPLDLILVATGILSDGDRLQPEKTFRNLSSTNLHRVFAVNAIGSALVAKHFLPHMPKNRKSVFAALSARVGSIEDNHLGGWYGYRASKAALNMILKTAAIEVRRRFEQAIIVGLHPGTVNTRLSAPFQANVSEEKLFTPDFSATKLLAVIDRLDASDSGRVFAWDGQRIPY